jgi:hypothetical protein
MSAESPEQQTAASQELKFVSSLPRELEPVLRDMLVNAVRICEASYGAIFHSARNSYGDIDCPERSEWVAAAMLGVSTAFAELWQRWARRQGPRIALGRVVETAFSQVVETCKTVHIEDATTGDEYVVTGPRYIEGESIYVPAADRKSFRTFLSVPIFKDNKLIYIFVIYRREARPFTDKQIRRAQDLAERAVTDIREIQEAQGRELLSGIRKLTSPEAALETIKNYLNLRTTEGRAQKLLKKALKSGEVYFEKDPYVKDAYVIDENDLLGWLDQYLLLQQSKSVTGKPEPVAKPTEQPQPERAPKVFSTKDWIVNAVNTMKADGEVSARTRITPLAKALADRMDKAVAAGKVRRSVGWRHIKNQLPAWGLWPFKKTK